RAGPLRPRLPHLDPLSAAAAGAEDQETGSHVPSAPLPGAPGSDDPEGGDLGLRPPFPHDPHGGPLSGRLRVLDAPPPDQGGDGAFGVGADGYHPVAEADLVMEGQACGVGDDDGILLPGRRLRWCLRREAPVKSRLDLLALGLSHHTAPIAIRERVAVAADRLEEALRDLSARPGI